MSEQLEYIKESYRELKELAERIEKSKSKIEDTEVLTKYISALKELTEAKNKVDIYKEETLLTKILILKSILTAVVGNNPFGDSIGARPMLTEDIDIGICKKKLLDLIKQL